MGDQEHIIKRLHDAFLKYLYGRVDSANNGGEPLTSAENTAVTNMIKHYDYKSAFQEEGGLVTDVRSVLKENAVIHNRDIVEGNKEKLNEGDVDVMVDNLIRIGKR